MLCFFVLPILRSIPSRSLSCLHLLPFPIPVTLQQVIFFLHGLRHDLATQIAHTGLALLPPCTPPVPTGDVEVLPERPHVHNTVQISEYHLLFIGSYLSCPSAINR